MYKYKHISLVLGIGYTGMHEDAWRWIGFRAWIGRDQSPTCGVQTLGAWDLGKNGDINEKTNDIRGL